MARTPVFCLRLALSVVLLTAGSAYAQMVGGGGFQSAPGSTPTTAVTARPSSTYSNPYTNNGVARGTSADPYAAAGQSVAPYGMYVAPLGTVPSTMPAAGAQTQGVGTAGAQPSAYGAEGQPAAPPRYSIEAPPPGGPYAAAPQSAQPQYAQPQYAQPYAQPYGPPQYAPPQQVAQPYAQPQQYAPPQQQYAPPPQPGVASQAMAPAYNQIASPYAASRAAAMPISNQQGSNQQGAAPQGPSGPPAEGGYTLGPGDKVRVTIFDEQDLSGEYQLDANGNIRLPLAGVVHAGGYTGQGLEAALYAALVPNYLRNPRIIVDITTYRPIYVVGQVQKPGQYAYVNDMTMLNAIGLAGGFTSQAKESTVYVRHAGAAKEEQVSTAEPLLIRPGDTIRIDTTLFWDAMNMFAPLSGPAYLASSVR